MGGLELLQVVPVLAGGALAQTGDFLQNYYLAGNTRYDYFGGGPKDYRNWLAFKLPSFPGPLQGAELRLGAGTTRSLGGSEVWELHHVTSAVTNLLQPVRNTPWNVFPPFIPSPALYADLGDGPVFGRATISTNQNPGTYSPGAPVLVTLTPAALAALTLAQGTNFAFGGVVSTLDGDTNTEDLVFFNSAIGAWPVELVLNFGDGAPTVDMPVLRGGLPTSSERACFQPAGRGLFHIVRPSLRANPAKLSMAGGRTSAAE